MSARRLIRAKTVSSWALAKFSFMPTDIKRGDHIMVKKTWWVALLLATIMLLFSVSPIFAAASTIGFTTWPVKTTTEVKKVWSITFNSALLRASVNNSAIYVMNNKQAKVATIIGLSANSLTVTVTPLQAYAAGDYNLYISSGITSLGGKKLAEQIIVPFTVEVTTPASPVSANYILDVKSNFNSYVTELDVQTSPDVYKVNVNKTKMQYMGDDMYSAGIFGLDEGSTILLEAYDQNGRLLQSYNCIVN